MSENAYEPNQAKVATPDPAVVGCPFEGKKPSAIFVVKAPASLDLSTIQVRISNTSGFSQAKKPEADKTVTFDHLPEGDYIVDVIFATPPKRAPDPSSKNKLDMRATVQQYSAKPRKVSVAGPPVVATVTAESDDPVKLTLSTERSRAFLEGKTKKAGPIEFQLSATAGRKAMFEGIQLVVGVSRDDIFLYGDSGCTQKLTVKDGEYALTREQIALLKDGKPIALWAIPQSSPAFTLTFDRPKVPAPGPAPIELVASEPLQFDDAIEFLEGTSKFLQLIDAFETVDEIRNSVPRIRSLSALVDMKPDEFANFAIKRLVIRKGVLAQRVKVCINPPLDQVGKNAWAPANRAGYVSRGVELDHPDVPGQPLFYSDFIVDRSGPKFLGALDADVAVEALMYKDACITTLLHRLQKEGKGGAFASSLGCDLIDNVCKLARDRFAILKRDNLGKYADLTETEIAKAVSVYQQKHMAQRRLSDFDLTARETDTLSRAIWEKVKVLDEMVPHQASVSPELIQAIGWQCWSRGGPIETAKIIAALDVTGAAQAQKYFASVEKDPLYFAGEGHSKMGYAKNDKPFYHLLIREIGPEIIQMLPDGETRVDNFYGLGIPFFGPEVYEDGDALSFHTEEHPPHGKKKEDGYKEEIGDIINDETSHYGKVLSHNANIRTAIENLGIDVGTFDKTKNFRENLEAQLEGKDAGEVKRYKERAAFIDTMMMFEQISKKEAQSQLYKRDLIECRDKKPTADADGVKKHAGKLMGNVSDVSQFLLGVDIAERVAAAKGPDGDATVKLMKALKQTTMLSCCIAMPRWGITKANVKDVQDSADATLFTAATFAASINERSYAHFSSTHVDAYSAPRVHVEWAKIDEEIAKQRLSDFNNGMRPVWEFLHTQEAFFGAMDNLIKAIGDKADRAPAIAEVKAALKSGVLPQVPELVKLIGGSLDTLVDALAEQAEESAAFQVARDAKKKPAPAPAPVG